MLDALQKERAPGLPGGGPQASKVRLFSRTIPGRGPERHFRSQNGRKERKGGAPKVTKITLAKIETATRFVPQFCLVMLVCQPLVTQFRFVVLACKGTCKTMVTQLCFVVLV